MMISKAAIKSIYEVAILWMSQAPPEIYEVALLIAKVIIIVLRVVLVVLIALVMICKVIMILLILEVK